MPKKESEKLWQIAHKDKVSEYGKRYRTKKTTAKVVIEPWLKEEIDKVKDPNQTYGNWVRQLVEEWGKKAIEFK